MRTHVLVAFVVVTSFALGYNLALNKNLNVNENSNSNGLNVPPKLKIELESKKQIASQQELHNSVTKLQSTAILKNSEINELRRLLTERANEISKIQAELNEQREPMRKYKLLLDAYKKYDTFDTILPSLNENLRPAFNVEKFFRLTESQAIALENAAATTLTQVKDWELINAQLVEKDDIHIVYDLPMADQILFEIKDSFKEQLLTIMGVENELFVKTMVDRAFIEFSVRRELRYSAVGEHTPGGIMAKFQILRYRNDAKRPGMATSMGVPERYSHLFY